MSNKNTSRHSNPQKERTQTNQGKENKGEKKERGIVPDSLPSAHAFLQNPTRG
jgi:hypothetical protein